jgi:hypothetical protein
LDLTAIGGGLGGRRGLSGGRWRGGRGSAWQRRRRRRRLLLKSPVINGYGVLPPAVFSDGVVFHIAAFYSESFLNLDGFSLGRVEVDSAFVEACMEVVGFRPSARLV